MTAALVFRSPWLGALALAATVGVVALVTWRSRRRRPRPWGDDAPVANVAHALADRTFRSAVRRYRALAGAELAMLSVAGLAATVLAMRPLSEQTREASAINRDVMLCLDVSGSMKELDESLLRRFVDISSGLPGDRIGLTIWNGAAITVFPLTDDGEYVTRMLEYAVDQLNRGARSFVLGTEEGGSSLIGDGLASCVMRFDRPDEERARTIVLATDNALAGEPIVSLDEAAAMAAARSIRVYGIAVDGHITDYDAAELEAATAVTGGAYLTTADERMVETVVEQIAEMEATRLEQPPEVVRDDRPTDLAAALAAATASLAVLTMVLRR